MTRADDEVAFLARQEQRLLDIADELDSAGLAAAARAVMRAADQVAPLKERALERE